jgi:hypothetical protein
MNHPLDWVNILWMKLPSVDGPISFQWFRIVPDAACKLVFVLFDFAQQGSVGDHESIRCLADAFVFF